MQAIPFQALPSSVKARSGLFLEGERPSLLRRTPTQTRGAQAGAAGGPQGGREGGGLWEEPVGGESGRWPESGRPTGGGQPGRAQCPGGGQRPGRASPSGGRGGVLHFCRGGSSSARGASPRLTVAEPQTKRQAGGWVPPLRRTPAPPGGGGRGRGGEGPSGASAQGETDGG